MRLVTGQVAISGAAAQLTSSDYEVDQILVKSHRTNTNPVYVGVLGVTTATGWILSPGEQWAVDNEEIAGKVAYDAKPNEVYVIGTAGTDRVSWQAWRKAPA